MEKTRWQTKIYLRINNPLQMYQAHYIQAQFIKAHEFHYNKIPNSVYLLGAHVPNIQLACHNSNKKSKYKMHHVQQSQEILDYLIMHVKWHRVVKNPGILLFF